MMEFLNTLCFILGWAVFIAIVGSLISTSIIFTREHLIPTLLFYSHKFADFVNGKISNKPDGNQ